MIVGITIKNFKGIKEIKHLSLSRFHVLVGPNGSGKTTFLDAIDFIRDCLIHLSPRTAVEMRGISDFKDLTWLRQGGTIEIELWLDLSSQVPDLKESLLCYRLSVRQDNDLGVCVESESLRHLPQRAKFIDISPSDNISIPIIGKKKSGKDFYYRIKENKFDTFNFGKDKLALALTPPDNERYPIANAVRLFLMKGIRYIQLDSTAMRQPCPAIRFTDLELDGSNLARVLGRLIMTGNNKINGKHNSEIIWATPDSAVAYWVNHLRYALPDLVNIGWSRRQVDNAEFIVLKYENGLEAPSWILSDGTLRMMALTLLAFLPAEPAVYLVEEPENGVHPQALEIILRSLSTIPCGQMLLATHSPFVVQQCGLEPLLCFSMDENGTRVQPGEAHPGLADWDGSPDLGVVFGAGVL